MLFQSNPCVVQRIRENTLCICFWQWIRPEGTFEDNRKRILDANVESMNCCRLWVENVQGLVKKRVGLK